MSQYGIFSTLQSANVNLRTVPKSLSPENYIPCEVYRDNDHLVIKRTHHFSPGVEINKEIINIRINLNDIYPYRQQILNAYMNEEILHCACYGSFSTGKSSYGIIIQGHKSQIQVYGGNHILTHPLSTSPYESEAYGSMCITDLILYLQ